MRIADMTVTRYVTMQGSDMGHTKGHERILGRIHTDEGVTGTGFVSTSVFSHGVMGDLAAVFLRRNLRNVILGHNPFETEKIWSRMYQVIHRFGSRGIFRKCVAAVDFALWDLKGKYLKLPVAGLMGDRRDRIPTYCNVGQQGTPDELARKAEQYVRTGHTALKIRGGSSAVPLKEATRRVAAVREAIGPDVKLMVDINGSWDADTAIRMLKEWEKYDLYWLEEPVPPEDLDGYRRVKQHAGSVYIAAGEQNAGIHDFKRFVDNGVLDIAQPNATATGGITDWLKIYHYVTTFNIPVCPWNLQHIHIQLAAGLPNVKWIEYISPDRDYYHNLFFRGPVIREEKTEDGIFLVPPDAHGFGLELDEEVAERTMVKE